MISSEGEPPLVASNFNVPVLTEDFIPLKSDTVEIDACDLEINWWRARRYRKRNCIVVNIMTTYSGTLE